MAVVANAVVICTDSLKESISPSTDPMSRGASATRDAPCGECGIAPPPTMSDTLEARSIAFANFDSVQKVLLASFTPSHPVFALIQMLWYV